MRSMIVAPARTAISEGQISAYPTVGTNTRRCTLNKFHTDLVRLAPNTSARAECATIVKRQIHFFWQVYRVHNFDASADIGQVANDTIDDRRVTKPKLRAL
jgi:hypothetical protein